jgi:hypothetical protein
VPPEPNAQDNGEYHCRYDCDSPTGARLRWILD